jgi:hypothetical protein
MAGNGENSRKPINSFMKNDNGRKLMRKKDN